MSQLALRAEVSKLARLLGANEKKLEFLIAEDVKTLRALRAACNHALHQGDAKLFHKLAASTKLLPAAMVAVISHKAMGPVLCARVAGLLESDRAVDVAKRLPIPFLTDVTMQLDPSGASAVLQRMPVEITLAVSKEMIARKEYITMARFVDDLSPEAIEAVTAALDDADILRVGAFVESHKRLDELIDGLSDARLRSTIRAAAQQPDPLWGWTLAIWEAVSAKTRKRLGELALQEEKAMQSMAKQLRKEGLWDALLATSADMSKAAQQNIKSL